LAYGIWTCGKRENCGNGEEFDQIPHGAVPMFVVLQGRILLQNYVLSPTRTNTD
jgi:hypothetical protein